MEKYDPRSIEPKWQAFWEKNKTFRSERRPGKPKIYVLDMFPYPSGAGLHVGHPEGYTATDIVARYKRMRGFDVMHPMGWDAFGLPAEQHAVRTGTHPAVTTAANIENFRRQLKSLGFAYDWDREIATTDPDYVRWTQWIFLQLFRRGLAYQAEIPVNWCPALGTVLANEEVIDGKSEVGGHPVIRTPLRQWLLRITAYADALLQGLDTLDWPDTKAKQTHWIGRSEGAEISFEIKDFPPIEVFTTRPDTLFGVTYLVLAPEHPLVGKITAPEHRAAMDAYVRSAARKSDLDRTEAKEKTGVPSGATAIHPFTGQAIPIWVGDYVLGSYGTGAVMGVPAHDERDFQFATKYSLPIVEVIRPDGVAQGELTGKLTAAYTEPGILIGSGPFSGRASEEAKRAITTACAEKGRGGTRIHYRSRDWVFSRQRYWGEPIPIYFPVDMKDPQGDPRRGGDYQIRYDQPIAVDEQDLPLKLPELDDYKPGEDPAGPLARAADWRFFQKDGKWFARETNTMPQWAGSCWYYLRFLDPKNQNALISKEAYDAWMPVDLYVGGSEHAVLHLLYARFWHKVLFDLGVVTHAEPFQKLVHQGLILGEVEYTGFQRADGAWVDATDVEESKDGADTMFVHTASGARVNPMRISEDGVEKRGAHFVLKEGGKNVTARAHKMSKSRGNVVNPDTIIEEHGADTLRAYEMFMGPLEMVKPWQTSAIIGVRRFLDRVWAVSSGALADAMDAETAKAVHRTIKKVTDDLEHMRFNTAISQLMMLSRRLGECTPPPREGIRALALLISPIAPHLAEEIWSRLGENQSIADASWPAWDEALCRDDVVEVPIQINGKVRTRVQIAAEAGEAEARAIATQAAAAWLEGKTIVKALYVPGKIVNFVIK